MKWIPVISCVGLVAASLLSLDSQQPTPSPNGAGSRLAYVGGQQKIRLLSDPRIPINSIPFKIDRCGSYYLTKCLSYVSGASPHGIEVTVNNVQIDLNGFTLRGEARGDSAIRITSGLHSVSIENGSLSGWNVNGVDARGVSLGSMNDVTSIDNGGDGASLGDYWRVRNCTFSRNRRNGLLSQKSCLVSHSLANENGDNGFKLAFDGLITDCCSSENSKDGFAVGQCGAAVNSVACMNSGYGLSGNDSWFKGCLLGDNLGGAFNQAGASQRFGSHWH